jgi:hypothetical protein
LGFSSSRLADTDTNTNCNRYGNHNSDTYSAANGDPLTYGYSYRNVNSDSCWYGHSYSDGNGYGNASAESNANGNFHFDPKTLPNSEVQPATKTSPHSSASSVDDGDVGSES